MHASHPSSLTPLSSLSLLSLSSSSLSTLCFVSSLSFPPHPQLRSLSRSKPKCFIRRHFQCCSAHPSSHLHHNVHLDPPQIQPTPLTPITVRNRIFFIKRDDLLEYAGVSSSKFRKFLSLFSTSTMSSVDYIVSYGGAQSNAMLALAQLCNHYNKPMVYITRQIPSHLSSTTGNFRQALQAGMIHLPISNEHFQLEFTDRPQSQVLQNIIALVQRQQFSFVTHRPLFVPQGGAWHGAELGVSYLAMELRQQISHLREQGCLVNKRPILFLPSGTGTTAFYLQKHLSDIVKIITIPVSGSERYLAKQMIWLSHTHPSNQTPSMNAPDLPDILRCRIRASFADVRPEKLALWHELNRATDNQFQFDLIYAPKAWEEMLLAMDQARVAYNGEDVMYYHSGGLEGNVSMLDRFRRKGLLPKDHDNL